MITTKRCILCKLNNEDKNDVRLLYKSEDVRKYLGGTVTEERFTKSFNKMCFTEDNHYFTVKQKESGNFVGLISLDKYHDGINIEISYQFLPIYWGKGLASETILAVLEYGFNTLNLSNIYAETQSANKASCTLLVKLGFTLVKQITRFSNLQSVYKKDAYHE